MWTGDYNQNDYDKYSVQGYRFMRHPLTEKIQYLNLLYPGRVMEPNYHYSGDNILNEKYKEMPDFKARVKDQFLKSKENELKMSMHLKGKHPIHRSPPVQPEEVIEDSSLDLLKTEPFKFSNSSTENNPNYSCYVGKPSKSINFSQFPTAEDQTEKKCEKRCDEGRENFSFTGNPVCYSPKYNKVYWAGIIICVLFLLFIILCMKKKK
jgi:hypothetical protein